MTVRHLTLISLSLSLSLSLLNMRAIGRKTQGTTGQARDHRRDAP